MGLFRVKLTVFYIDSKETEETLSPSHLTSSMLAHVPVQEFVFAAFEYGRVHGFEQGEFVGLFDLHIDIGLVEAGGAFGEDVAAEVDGLAAAHHTAAGAGHDFHEVVLLLAGLDGLEELVGVAQAADHGGADGVAFVVEGKFLQAHVAAHTDLLDDVDLFAVMAQHEVAEHGFGHAAAGTEDEASAGSDAEGHIGGVLFHVVQVEAVGLDHADELFRGEHEVYVLNAVGVGFGAEYLVLLGRAGRDGHGNEAATLRIGMLFVVGAEQSAEHLDRRTAGGQVRHKFRPLLFAEAYPRRAAAREEGERPFLQAAHQLFALFFDGEVGTEGGVVHFVEAEAMHHGHEAVHHVLAGGEAEAVADGGAHGRGHLSHDFHLGSESRAHTSSTWSRI